MLLACLALGLLSCSDTLEPQQPTPRTTVQQEVSGPVTVLRLTCTFSFPDGREGEVRCGESGEVASNVVIGATGGRNAELARPR